MAQWISPTIFSTIDGVSVLISYTFGALPGRIGAYRYVSAITSRDRLVDHINSMPQYCCVPGCTNFGSHVFPSDPELQKKRRVANKRLDESQKTSGHQESTTSFVKPTSERMTIRKRYQVRW